MKKRRPCFANLHFDLLDELLLLQFQIALAAVIHGASKNGHNMDSYVTEVLFGQELDEAKRNSHLSNIIEAVRSTY